MMKGGGRGEFEFSTVGGAGLRGFSSFSVGISWELLLLALTEGRDEGITTGSEGGGGWDCLVASGKGRCGHRL